MTPPEKSITIQPASHHHSVDARRPHISLNGIPGSVCGGFLIFFPISDQILHSSLLCRSNSESPEMLKSRKFPRIRQFPTPAFVTRQSVDSEFISLPATRLAEPAWWSCPTHHPGSTTNIRHCDGPPKPPHSMLNKTASEQQQVPDTTTRDTFQSQAHNSRQRSPNEPRRKTTHTLRPVCRFLKPARFQQSTHEIPRIDPTAPQQTGYSPDRGSRNS